MEAEKPYDQPSVSWRPRRAGGEVWVWRPENHGTESEQKRPVSWLEQADRDSKLSLCSLFFSGPLKIGWDPPMHVCVLNCFSCVQLFATLWTVAHQAPLSMGFPRQEHWSGLPCSPPGDLPNPGTENASPALADGFFTTEPQGKPRAHPYLGVLFSLLV